LLTHPTSERLIALGFTGMAKALDEQRHARPPSIASASKNGWVCWSTGRPPNETQSD